MPHTSDDAVEVMGDEEGDLSEGFVHLGPQDIIVRVRTPNHGTFAATMAPNLHIDAFCMSGRKAHRLGLENTPWSSDVQRYPAHSSMDSTKHRKTIRRSRCSDRRAELAFIIITIIIGRIVRFTRVGAANGGNFYTRDCVAARHVESE